MDDVVASCGFRVLRGGSLSSYDSCDTRSTDYGSVDFSGPISATDGSICHTQACCTNPSDSGASWVPRWRPKIAPRVSRAVEGSVGFKQEYLDHMNNFKPQPLKSVLEEEEPDDDFFFHHRWLRRWLRLASLPCTFTLQPCLYLPKVMNLLPDLNRRQREHTCLLAKFYRMPVLLHFAEILPYHKYFHLGDPEPLVPDAYLFCLIYTVGRFIDKHAVLPRRFGFMPLYNLADSFDWKLDSLSCRHRIFHLSEDGTWEEMDPFINPDEYFAV
ncbi:hypothetical protein PG997_000638 [Apiospora hydei]|uniref:Uncharacterized protein n=1 Tax=Apiospora hydei TaxID=1337664 RepID=A0ABR1XBB0_9PEZI